MCMALLNYRVSCEFCECFDFYCVFVVLGLGHVKADVLVVIIINNNNSSSF